MLTPLMAAGDGPADQPLIKIVLLAAIVVVTTMLTRSTAGARHQAIRRLLLVGFVVLAAVAGGHERGQHHLRMVSMRKLTELIMDCPLALL